MKTATLIYNPVAGGNPAHREKQVQEIATVLRDCSIGVKPARTTQPGTADHLARTAVGQGDNLILVCGGDGTLNEVINGIIPGNVTLGILPGGTANIAAKELGLPHDPVRAARELCTWLPHRIPVGLARLSVTARPGYVAPVNSCEDPDRGSSAMFSEHRSGDADPPPSGAIERSGRGPLPQEGRRYFLCIAGIGFDAYVVHRLSPAFKMSAGVMAYVVETLRQTLRYSFPRFRCRADGHESQATFAVVHRTSRYAGWLHLAPTADLFKDRLSLCLFKSHRRWRYFIYAAAALAGRHLRLRDVELIETQKVECVAAEPGTRIYVELDGEMAGKLPATFEVVPDALTILIPQRGCAKSGSVHGQRHTHTGVGGPESSGA